MNRQQVRIYLKKDGSSSFLKHHSCEIDASDLEQLLEDGKRAAKEAGGDLDSLVIQISRETDKFDDFSYYEYSLFCYRDETEEEYEARLKAEALREAERKKKQERHGKLLEENRIKRIKELEKELAILKSGSPKT